MSDDLLKKKRFPLNYPLDVLNVINAMSNSTSGLTIAGSMALKAQLYAGDFDMYEIVKLEGSSIAEACRKASLVIQKCVKELIELPNCYIGDIKAGEVAEWRVITGDIIKGKVVGFDYDIAERKLLELVKSGVIDREEANEAQKVMKRNPTPYQWLVMEKTVRPQIVRWSVEDVLEGCVRLRDGRRYYLVDAVQAPTIVKIDAVALVQNSRFTDFSNIYSFRWKSHTLNEVRIDPEHELKKNILLLLGDGDYFKLGKRIFAVAKMKKNGALIRSLTDVFNGDLGRLYSIISDLGTLQFLLTNERVIPIEKIRFEIDQMRGRLGLILDLDGVDTPSVLGELIKMTSLPATADGKARLAEEVERLMSIFTRVLNKGAKEELERLRLLPVPRTLLP